MVLQEEGSAAGSSAETSGPVLRCLRCQGGRGHRSRAPRPGAVPKPQPRVSARPEGSRSGGGDDGVAPSAPHLRESAYSAFSLPERACGEKALICPSFLPAAHHAAVAANQPPGAGAQARRGPSNSRPSPPPARGPQAWSGVAHPNPPQLLDARAERAATAGRREGAAPPASRGLERAWPPSRPRREGTHSAARRSRTRLAPLGARAPEDAGGLPRSRPALPPGRAPGAPVAPPPPGPQRGREGGLPPRRAHRSASRSPRGGHPEFSSPFASSFLLRPGACGY